MKNALSFSMYVYLNNIPILALNERTASGIANAMRCSKDKASACLQKMCDDGLLVFEPIGNYKVYFIKTGDHA